jgi:outer membrane protein assembly factor BamB
MKFAISLFLAILICSCSTSKQETGWRPIDLVPSSSILIFQSEDIAQTSALLSENSFIKKHENLPFIKQIKENIAFFSQFETSANAVFCFSTVGKKDIATTFITTSTDLDFNLLQNEVSNRKTFMYEDKEINEFTWKEQYIYAVWFGDAIIISDSKLIIENKIRDIANDILVDETFAKVLKTVNQTNPNLFIDLNEFKKIYNKAFDADTYSLFANLTDWVALDLKIEEGKLQLSGVGIGEELEKRKLSLLKNQDRIQHDISKLVPLNAIGFESYSITDFEAYLVQRKAYGLASKTAFQNLFEGVDEVSKIHFPEHDLVVLRSNEAAATFVELSPWMQLEKNFRDFEVFQLKETELLKIYAPLIALKQAKYVTQIEDFFVFSANIEALENVIINHVNRLNLQGQPSYQTQIEKLSSKSTALFYAISENWAEYMQAQSTSDFAANFEVLSFETYKGIGLQINVDEEYTYFNGVFQEVNTETKTTAVKQKSRFKLTEQSLTKPQLFTNWRTKQRDVFFQDQSLNAQLLDADGKPIWNIALGDLILGQAVEFDIYRNTRLQLAFATQNKVFVVDKNGDEVDPFPISFLEEITQPLQIFDYDNNGQYRFMICQSTTLKAYDKGGSEVKGFDFTTQNTAISSPPKHFRIGTKDYILLQEASGKLYILDRRGDVRVEYKTDVQFSGKPWFVYDGKFTSTTADGDLVQISEEGKVEITKKEFLPTHSIVANERLLVTLSENILQINEVEIELDYGLYTAPQILQIQDKTWVSVTDQQEKKLYVFDEFGNLLKGFPVYANSAVEYFSTDGSKIQLMLRGEENSILFYEIN